MSSIRDSDSLGGRANRPSPAITCGICGWDDEEEYTVEVWLGFIKHRGVILPYGTGAESEQSDCLSEEGGATPLGPAIKDDNGDKPV